MPVSRVVDLIGKYRVYFAINDHHCLDTKLVPGIMAEMKAALDSLDKDATEGRRSV